MKAVVFREWGPPSVLELVQDQPLPSRKAGELLVEVYATSVNPCDCKTRQGDMPRFHSVRPKIPGGDVAGVVVEADESSPIKPGTRVAFLSDGYRWFRPYGSYAEFITVPEGQVAVLPDGVDVDAAAALPLVSLTVFQAFDPINLKPGQRILIHAGAGGVGSVAIQVAKARRLHVTTTCSQRNIQFVKELGADVAIDYGKERFEEVCAGEPFDAVLDLVGGEYESRSMKMLKKGGTYVSVLAKGEIWPVIKGKLLGWLGLGPRYHVVSVQPNGQQMAATLELLKAGKLKPIIDRVLPLEQAREAHAYVEQDHARGKVILKIKQ